MVYLKRQITLAELQNPTKHTIMNETSPFVDPLDEGPKSTKLPGSLGTLTMLTIIACCIFIPLSIVGYFTAESTYANTEKVMQTENMPSFMKYFYNEDTLEMNRLMMENKVSVLIINVVSLGLCLFGAIQMRKLMKQGFYLWLMGEILPIVGMPIFTGVLGLKGWGSIFGYALAALFIFLYSRQLKYLK